HHRDRYHANGDDRRVAKEDQVLVLRQQINIVRESGIEYPPWISGRRDLCARLERGDKHIDRRWQEKDHEQDQEKIRPEQRAPPAAGDAAVADATELSGWCVGCCRRHGHASFPRRRTLRKMKNAAIARIGAINSDTEAPSGMSLPQIAK